MSSNEIWKPCVGFEQDYHVSSEGRVLRVSATRFSRPSGRPLAAKGMPNGYQQVVLSICCKATYKTIHSLVAEAFIGPRPEGNEVNHIDGDKTNNAVANLEYVTPKQNMAHAVGAGLRTYESTRKYPLTKMCIICGLEFAPDANHRGAS